MRMALQLTPSSRSSRSASSAYPCNHSSCMAQPFPSPAIRIIQSLIILRHFAERLPLRCVVAEDHQRHLFALDHIEEFLRAGAQLLLVIIHRPLLTLWREEPPQGD